MQPTKVIKSEVDKVVKYIFDYDGSPIEYLYVDNGTGKDIICLPSQTGCRLGCEFCYLTARKDQIVRQIPPTVSFNALKYVMSTFPAGDRPLLFSFMGSGDPMLNFPATKMLMGWLTERFAAYCRFGLATIFPWKPFTASFDRPDLTKVHLSLHFVDDHTRFEHMPKAMPIKESFETLSRLRAEGCKTEVHYTPYNKRNASPISATWLVDLLKFYDQPVKLLQYQSVDGQCELTAEERQDFIDVLAKGGVSYELYNPPGADINAACGQFEVNNV